MRLAIPGVPYMAAMNDETSKKKRKTKGFLRSPLEMAEEREANEADKDTLFVGKQEDYTTTGLQTPDRSSPDPHPDIWDPNYTSETETQAPGEHTVPKTIIGKRKRDHGDASQETPAAKRVAPSSECSSPPPSGIDSRGKRNKSTEPNAGKENKRMTTGASPLSHQSAGTKRKHQENVNDPVDEETSFKRKFIQTPETPATAPPTGVKRKFDTIIDLTTDDEEQEVSSKRRFIETTSTTTTAPSAGPKRKLDYIINLTADDDEQMSAKRRFAEMAGQTAEAPPANPAPSSVPRKRKIDFSLEESEEDEQRAVKKIRAHRSRRNKKAAGDKSGDQRE